MELIVGLRPLTQFDAYATPMLAAFTGRPDFSPYTAQKPSQDLQEVNPVTAPAGRPIRRPRPEHCGPDQQTVFNQAIWASFKDPGVPMPAPQHSLFPAPDDPPTPATPGDKNDDGH